MTEDSSGKTEGSTKRAGRPRRTETDSHNRKPKAQVTYLASNAICMNLNRLLRTKRWAAAMVDHLPIRKALRAGNAIQLPDRHSAILIKKGALDILLPVRSNLAFISRLRPGWAFANLPLLGVEDSGGQAVAAADCQIVTLDQDALRTILRKSPAITARLMEMVAHGLREFDIDHLLRRFGMTDAKLIRLLVHLADENDLIEGVSRRDLACMLSTSRQTLSKALGRLRQRGLIEASRMRIKLLNLDRTTNLWKEKINERQTAEEIKLAPTAQEAEE
jgi:CRP-like cAMP-binding protein